jgi:hypothetical protein
MIDIVDWQRRFYAQPRVYVVIDSDGCIEGVYETSEAAQLSVDWGRKRGDRLRINSMPVCSLRLAQERWEPLAKESP